MDTEVRLPYDEEALQSGDPVRVAEYVLELVKTLQELLERITVISNYTVELSPGEAIYYALKQADGTYANGTWRHIQIGDNLELQVKIDGEFEMQKRNERPI